jgi:phenylpyruvate tautomerase PptA (4-oxalocrotonate tautomerase family)
MPILDVEPVIDAHAAIDPTLAQRLADAAAAVFGSPPGRVWVRLRPLPAAQYAENGAVVSDSERPAFVTVLHAQPPQGDARAQEAAALTGAIAGVLGRSAERVHVQYAAAGAGRQAFGGRLVSSS